MKCNLILKELRAAMLFATTDPCRYVLNGVQVEYKAGGKPPLLATTDGRRLACIQSQAPQLDNPEFGEVVIARESVEQAFKLFPKDSMLYIETSDRTVSFSCAGVTLKNTRGIVEGNYPKWRQVVPKKSAMKKCSMVTLNPSFVGDVGKARDILVGPKSRKDSGAVFYLAEESNPIVARLTHAPNIWMCIMTMRETPEEQEIWQPDFLEIETKVEVPA